MKTERIYVRFTPEEKSRLQELSFEQKNTTIMLIEDLVHHLLKEGLANDTLRDVKDFEPAEIYYEEIYGDTWETALYDKNYLEARRVRIIFCGVLDKLTRVVRKDRIERVLKQGYQLIKLNDEFMKVVND